MPRHLDALIAGQGIAGTLLAYHLTASGLTVRVVDPCPDHGTASQAAAGILSPYTGRRYKAPERLDAMLHECQATYAAIARRVGEPLYHSMPIWRILQRETEADDIQRRRAERPGRELLTAVSGDDLPDGVRAPLGATCISGGGQVDLDRLIRGMRHWLRSRGELIEDRVEADDITLSTTGNIRWRDVTAATVIFCEGAGAFSNPWWRDLPWRVSRGETLDVEPAADGLWPSVIVTGSKSLVPLGQGRYRLGSTYDHEPHVAQPTPEARETLLSALPQLVTGDPRARVLGGRTGVRPGSRTGTPFSGFHPRAPQIGILNGFGSRGTLLAPLHARRLAEHLANGTPVPADADVGRRSELQAS